MNKAQKYARALRAANQLQPESLMARDRSLILASVRCDGSFEIGKFSFTHEEARDLRDWIDDLLVPLPEKKEGA